MQEEKFLISWLRMDVKKGKAEMQRLNEEAKQKESGNGKREVEREGERDEIKRRCWKWSSDVFEDFSSTSEWESDWAVLGCFGVCACCFFVL